MKCIRIIKFLIVLNVCVCVQSYAGTVVAELTPVQSQVRLSWMGFSAAGGSIENYIKIKHDGDWVHQAVFIKGEEDGSVLVNNIDHGLQEFQIMECSSYAGSSPSCQYLPKVTKINVPEDQESYSCSNYGFAGVNVSFPFPRPVPEVCGPNVGKTYAVVQGYAVSNAISAAYGYCGNCGVITENSYGGTVTVKCGQ